MYGFIPVISVWMWEIIPSGEMIMADRTAVPWVQRRAICPINVRESDL